MDIVIANDFANPSGGATRVAIESAIGLATRGHRVHFFAGTGLADQRLTDVGVRVSSSDAPTYPARGLRGAKASLWDPSTAERFSEFIRALRPAIVHFHSHRDALSPSVLAASIGRFPTVLTCHDYAFGCPYGCFFDFQRGQPCGQVGLSSGCVRLHCNRKTMLHKLVALAKHRKEHGAGRLGDLAGLIYVSEFSRRMLAPYVGTQREFYIPNPISVSREKNVGASQRKGFVFVGALTEGKGVGIAAQAARQARLPLTFIGDGDSRALIGEPDAFVSYAGTLPRQEMLLLIRRARALVFPVLWFETQGMVVAEALACGTPVIATDHSAAIEQIEDGRNGLLVKSADIGGLARAMVRLQDDALVAHLSAAAYEGYWSQPATLDVHLDALETVYREVQA